MNQTSFHESTIVNIRRENGSLILELEDIFANDVPQRALVRMMNVSSITCDGELVSDLVPVQDDGEILKLEYVSKTVHLIIEWMDYKEHKTQTKSYRITCDSLDVTLCPVEGEK